jgi:hypothetical protein
VHRARIVEIFNKLCLQTFANSANIANMSSRRAQEKHKESAKGTAADSANKRLWTTLQDDELRRRYQKLQEATRGLADSELLRQGVIRLINDFEKTGKLTFENLMPEGGAA